MTVEIFLLGAVLLAIGLIFTSTLRTATPPLPTSALVRETLLAMLPETVDGPVYELGSGWDGLARTLARRYPSAPVRGFEVSVLPWFVPRVFLGVSGPENLSLTCKNSHATDLSDAALVVCYLTGPAMEKLRPKLEAELPPGTLVASNTFAFHGWQAIDTQTAPDMYKSQVYLHRVG
jgi:hypothetical protein